MLAINGGTPYVSAPLTTGHRFGGRELEYLKEALEQNTLFYAHGSLVRRFTRAFAELYGMKYCVATSSGTAAVHTALGVLDVGPGDEVIVPPITDMGSIIGILYQNAVPVFADVDLRTYNMTAQAIEEVITPRTKVILITHLAGNPCDMDPIMALAARHNIHVVEDCAQSYCTYYKGRLVGTIGEIGCFSTNDFKHISTGDGGMCVMNDEALYRKALRFTDKGYNRLGRTTEELRRVDALCPNYRMTELQGAVGLAQLDRLEWICGQRRELGRALTERLEGIPGLHPPAITPDSVSSYWFYMLRVEREAFPGGNQAFARALAAEGIPSEAGYIGRCIYEYEIFRNRSIYPGTDCPYGCANYPVSAQAYEKGLCPVAEAVLDQCVKLNMSEFYTMEDIDAMAGAIRKVCDHRAEL